MTWNICQPIKAVTRMERILNTSEVCEGTTLPKQVRYKASRLMAIAMMDKIVVFITDKLKIRQCKVKYKL